MSPNITEKAGEPKPVLMLAGPTGIGKTELAVRLAESGPYELISADSMQIYKGMGIGTAQPTAEELRGVPIHGVAMTRHDAPFNAKIFIDFCDRVHTEILERGNTPIYVGGTGMYLRSLRWGLLESPEIDPGLRDELEEEIAEVGLEALHKRLSKLDPAAGERIPPQDRVRIIRALELAQSGGGPLDKLQAQWDEPTPRFAHRLVILNCPRQVLLERIELRVDAMIEAGWVKEVAALLAAGASPEAHCMKALGYRQILSHLSGELTLDETRKQIKAKTRQFSKRQMTWFRKEQGAHWVEFDGQDVESALPEIKNLLDS